MQKINYVCFGNASGYSQAAQDTILALHNKYDIRIQYIFPNTVQRSGISKERTRLFKSLQDKPFDKDSIQIFHCIPSLQRQFEKQRCRINIGFATFETFDPPNNGRAGWVHLLNKNEGIICPSRFNEKIFKHAGVIKPIFYLPHVCDTNIFNDKVEPIEKRDIFTFLFFADWRVRKGYRVLIEAWCKEFSNRDKVQLVFKTSKTEKAKATIDHIIKEIGFSKNKIAPIIFEKRTFDEKELPRFLKSVDCLVSPTRGEGFGLPGLQCMFLKVPVIITDFSGCQDYANEETACLLKPKGYELINDSLDGLPQFRNKKWPIITVRDTQIAMRDAFENYGKFKNRADFAFNYVNNNFTYSNLVRKFNSIVEKFNNAKILS